MLKIRIDEALFCTQHFLRDNDIEIRSYQIWAFYVIKTTQKLSPAKIPYFHRWGFYVLITSLGEGTMTIEMTSFVTRGVYMNWILA